MSAGRCKPRAAEKPREPLLFPRGMAGPSARLRFLPARPGCRLPGPSPPHHRPTVPKGGSMNRIAKLALFAALALCITGTLFAQSPDAQSTELQSLDLQQDPATLSGTQCGSSVCAQNELCCVGCEGATFCISKKAKFCPLPVCPIPPGDPLLLPPDPMTPQPSVEPGLEEPGSDACRILPECFENSDCDAVCGAGG